MDFENMEYIMKRIAAGNDLSPKHGAILRDKIKVLATGVLAAHTGDFVQTYYSDNPSICVCDACQVALDALEFIE